MGVSGKRFEWTKVPMKNKKMAWDKNTCIVSLGQFSPGTTVPGTIVPGTMLPGTIVPAPTKSVSMEQEITS